MAGQFGRHTSQAIKLVSQRLGQNPVRRRFEDDVDGGHTVERSVILETDLESTFAGCDADMVEGLNFTAARRKVNERAITARGERPGSSRAVAHAGPRSLFRWADVQDKSKRH